MNRVVLLATSVIAVSSLLRCDDVAFGTHFASDPEFLAFVERLSKPPQPLPSAEEQLQVASLF